MGADFIPLAGPPTTPEFRAKHCAGSDYRCIWCVARLNPRGSFECIFTPQQHGLARDATGYPLRLPGCGEVDNG